jgi:hypothetical protein
MIGQDDDRALGIEKADDVVLVGDAAGPRPACSAELGRQTSVRRCPNAGTCGPCSSTARCVEISHGSRNDLDNASVGLRSMALSRYRSDDAKRDCCAKLQTAAATSRHSQRRVARGAIELI